MEQRHRALRRRTFLPFPLPELLRRLLYAGTGDYPPADRRGLVAANVTGYLATLSSLSYAATYALHDLVNLAPVVAGNLLSAILTACVPFFHRFGRVAGAVMLAVTIFTTIFYFTAVLGRTSGIQLNYIGASALAFVVVGLDRPRLIVAIIVSAAALHLAAWFLFPQGTGELEEQVFLNQLYVFSALSIMSIIALVVWYAFRLAREAQDQSDRLLLNVMPEPIAERLKSDPEQTIAERFDEATVLFADLCNFTPLAGRLGPVGIVSLLDELFSRFDRIALDNGVEKIKTIGDGYMAVAGLPERRDDHIEAAVRVAVAMKQAIRSLSKAQGLDLDLRIGLASGPVTAGVIGRSKFAYDVWGETVNLAARLEAYASSGDIFVGERIHAALDERYRLTPLGEIDLKGIGPVKAWRLEA